MYLYETSHFSKCFLGITKTNGSAGTKPVREPKSVPKATNVNSNNNSNNSSNNNNNNKTTARKASVETKPTKKQSTGVKKQPEEKLQSTNTNKKVRKSSKGKKKYLNDQYFENFNLII